MARNTGTTFSDQDGNNVTRTHLSTNIIVKVAGNSVGVLQTLSYDESRSVEFISEISTDGQIDSAPKSSATVTGSASRIRWGGLRIAQAFSRGFVHISAQRVPFDIEIQDIFASSDSSNSIITTLKNVWLTKIGTKYEASNFIITDDISFEAETVFSTMNSKNVAQSLGLGQGTPIILNAYERQADRGLYRGSLDANGIMTAFLTDPRE